jgi:hypothetical protein
MALDLVVAAARQSAASARMAKEQARTRASFDTLPGPFPSDHPLFPTS